MIITCVKVKNPDTSHKNAYHISCRAHHTCDTITKVYTYKHMHAAIVS